MTDREPFWGSMLILIVILAFINCAADNIIKHHNWWGVCLALSNILPAIFAARSIYRDRVQ